uniref:Uncharacterized protein n=1 Tax=Globodera rostochiensis TaxID=31243 RepID=A0A914HMV8_GLORO
MELFFLRHADYERLYNCTGLDIDSVPLERRRFVPESITVCVLCAIYYVLYVPCMYSIWKHMRDNSCYKLMFYIGIIDLGILWLISFFSAWLNLRGAVFCSYPTLIFFTGMAITSQWNAETTADLVLAFNRCLDLSSPRLSHFLFSGRRTSLWIAGCTLYAFYWAVFNKPAVYSSAYFGWFFYPFVGYRNGDINEYEHWLHVVHNIAVALLCPSMYLIFVAKLCYNVRKSRQQFGVVVSEMSAMRIQTFFQVFLISLLNTLTSSIYVYMQFNETHQWMITLAGFAWISFRHLFGAEQNHTRGLPPTVHETVQASPYQLRKRAYCTSSGNGQTSCRPLTPPPVDFLLDELKKLVKR